MSKSIPEAKLLVNHIVIHELVKEQTKLEAKVYPSNELLNIDDQAISLLEILNGRYSSSRENIRHGKFSDDENKHFPKEFRNYINNASEASFLQMTKLTLENLRDLVEVIAPAKGGYFVFAKYELHSQNFFAVFLIRNTEGKLIERNSLTNRYKINTTEHLDLEKVAMGCRLNIDDYLKAEGRYLSFTRKNQDFSEYFTNWIAAEELVDDGIYTEALIKIANRIELPLDENGKSIDRAEFKKKIYDVVQTLPSSNLKLATLDQIFYDGEEKFSSFAQENNIVIDTEFKPIKRLMKKFVHIAVNEENIKLEFGYNDLNSKIKVVGNIVTIESKKLADSIKKRI